MLKYYKYRLYPNKQQRSLIEKHFGCVRFVYNWGLHTKNSAYLTDKKVLNYYDLSSLLTLLKISLPWLNEVNAQSLQSALRNLDNAFVRFFKKHWKI
jgi:putative transposase